MNLNIFLHVLNKSLKRQFKHHYEEEDREEEKRGHQELIFVVIIDQEAC